jgi:HK97 family phage prohead protease
MSTYKLETRCYNAEVRGEGSEKKPVVEGYSVLFNNLSHPLEGYRESVSPTAFVKTLKTLDESDDDYDPDHDVAMNVNHGEHGGILLGRTKNKSLQLRCDDRGLHFRCQLSPDISAHMDAWQAVRSGLLDQCSFAFVADPEDGDEWSEAQDDDGKPYVLRRLKNVKLYDCSLVNSAAYPNTSVSARNIFAVSAEEVADKMRRFKAAALAREIERDERARKQAHVPCSDAERRAKAERIGLMIHAEQVQEWLHKKFPE